MSLQQFFSILRARWAVAALIFALTVGAALAWVLLRPTYYTARAPVLVDVQSSEVGGGYSPGLLTSYLATQMDIARSDRVAERALDLLKDGPPLQLPPPPKAPTGDVSQRQAMVRAVQSGLEVKPARESNIINITWTGRSPGDAARVANAFARAYADVSLDLRTAPAKREAAWLDDQAKALRVRLEQAQARLSEFQQRAGIVSTDERVDHEVARLNDLSTQLTLIQAQTTDSSAKRGASRDTVAEVIQSPLINALKADIGRLEGKLQDSAATLGASHPQMQRMEGELAALRSRLATETTRIGSSIETTYQASRQRERELQGALAAQRARVMAINKDRGQWALLRQDVEQAQKAFDAVSNNASKTRLQSLAQQTNLVLLASAVEPLEPIGPSKRQALAIAAVAGMLLAVAGAVVLELGNRRVRTIDDITMVTQLPVLASVPASTPAFTALPAARRRLALSTGSSA